MKRYKPRLREAEDIESKIVDFFSKNPNPTDDQIHKFSDDEGIDIHKFEEIIYGLLGSFFGAGRSKDFKDEYDAKELKKGIEIEMEHTTNKYIAERIAKDHLAELPNYYTLLIKMETENEEEG